MTKRQRALRRAVGLMEAGSALAASAERLGRARLQGAPCFILLREYWLLWKRTWRVWWWAVVGRE